MDVINLNLNITVVVSVVIAVGVLLGYWFKADKKFSLKVQELESSMILRDQKIKHLEDQDVMTHKRIDSLKSETVKNTDSLQEKYDGISTGMNELKVKMEKNKGEILSAIANLKT